MAHIDTHQIRHWLFNEALPFWAERGADPIFGGPVEEVSLDGGPSDPGFKRVRVFCRQVYVYAHAYLMGWEAGLGHATTMYDALVRFAWQGPEKGWAKTVSSNNDVLDATTDLYDNAFALYALAWYYRVNPSADVLNYMMATATLIDTTMRHPKSGFWHQLPPSGPRLQNPHMHLLEACLACFESTRLPIFERLAREVIDLFETRFFHAERGTLCEYFDDELMCLDGDYGLIVEPGHQFEWAWILASASTLLGLDLSSQAKALIDYGEANGVDHISAATFNSIYRDGRSLDSGSRTWPNTERLKAGVATFDMFGADTKPIILPTLDLLFSRYLGGAVTGGWIDAFDASGNPTARAMPTSTFYHLFLAFAEVLRVGEPLNNLTPNLHR
jgi:mannose/cellobiose epimerase-like protein (N-acyl-D-glucosamine 2-epimerase family)